MMRLYLIRHGFTLPTGPDSHEWPLSPEGEEQALKLADAPFWNEVSTLYSSPEAKAVSTVRPASVRRGLRIKEDERLREAGRPPVWYEEYDEVVRRYLGGSMPEDWEEPERVSRRVGECLSELRSRHSGESIAVCGHGLMFTLHLSILAVNRNIFDLWRSIGFCRVALLEDEEMIAPFREPEDVL